MEHEHDFKPGDIVRLKSGGPNMTVVQAHYNSVSSIRCLWFNGQGMLTDTFFPLVTLTPVGPSVAPARPAPGSAADLPEGWAR